MKLHSLEVQSGNPIAALAEWLSENQDNYNIYSIDRVEQDGTCYWHIYYMD